MDVVAKIVSEGIGIGRNFITAKEPRDQRYAGCSPGDVARKRGRDMDAKSARQDRGFPDVVHR